MSGDGPTMGQKPIHASFGQTEYSLHTANEVLGYVSPAHTTPRGGCRVQLGSVQAPRRTRSTVEGSLQTQSNFQVIEGKLGPATNAEQELVTMLLNSLQTAESNWISKTSLRLKQGGAAWDATTRSTSLRRRRTNFRSVMATAGIGWS